MSDCPNCARRAAAEEEERARQLTEEQARQRLGGAAILALGMAMLVQSVYVLAIAEDGPEWPSPLPWLITVAVVAPLAWWRHWGDLGAR